MRENWFWRQETDKRKWKNWNKFRNNGNKIHIWWLQVSLSIKYVEQCLYYLLDIMRIRSVFYCALFQLILWLYCCCSDQIYCQVEMFGFFFFISRFRFIFLVCSIKYENLIGTIWFYTLALQQSIQCHRIQIATKAWCKAQAFYFNFFFNNNLQCFYLCVPFFCVTTLEPPATIKRKIFIRPTSVIQKADSIIQLMLLVWLVSLPFSLLTFFSIFCRISSSIVLIYLKIHSKYYSDLIIFFFFSRFILPHSFRIN